MGNILLFQINLYRSKIFSQYLLDDIEEVLKSIEGLIYLNHGGILCLKMGKSLKSRTMFL